MIRLKTTDPDITTEDLNDLLNEITYHWSSDQVAMRRTRRVLLKLIGTLAKRELKKSSYTSR